MKNIEKFCTCAILVLAPLVPSAKGQCEPQWLPSGGISGVDGNVYASTFWDPDGPGPERAKLVVGGLFSGAGDILANNIAAFDPMTQSWEALGGGIGGFEGATVRSLLALSNGDLIVGGNFSLAGSVSASSIARWSDGEWQNFGLGTNSIVAALAELSDGSIVAGGSFDRAGSSTARYIARWDGLDWFPIGGNINNGVLSLQVLPDGNLIAAGSFTNIGGVAANRIAFWNGVVWSPLGAGTDGTIKSLAKAPDGSIVAGGTFSRAGTAQSTAIAKWNGLAWSAVGAGASSFVDSVIVMPNGDVIAGRSDGKVASWDGSKWFIAGEVDSQFAHWIGTFALSPTGELFIGGAFQKVSDSRARSLAKRSLDGTWSAIDRRTNGALFALTMLPSGEVIAGGEFTAVNGVASHRVAKWDGVTWSPVGAGLLNWNVSSLAGTLNDLIAGCRRTLADGSSRGAVARWNGQDWTFLGPEFNRGVQAVAQMSGGRVAAGGFFWSVGGVSAKTVAIWDHLGWQPIGIGMDGPTTYVSALQTMPSGDLYAAGFFNKAGGVTCSHIARWDGSSWSALRNGVQGSVAALTILPDGRLGVAGDFTGIDGSMPYVKGLAAWNGQSWSTLGTQQSFGAAPLVYALKSLPDGQVVAAGGASTIGGVSPYIARWDGSIWSGFPAWPNGAISAVTPAPGDEIMIGGSFTRVGTRVAASFARWTASPKPWIAYPPSEQSKIASASLSLTAVPASGYSNVSYQWQRESSFNNFDNILNGPGNGGTVTGASGQLPSPTDGTPATLTISNIQPSDAGLYRVTFWNSCGEATSVPVEVKVKAHIADINADGQVDDADFILFSAQYDLMLCADAAMPDGCSADFNQDGFVDDADFTIFVPAYNTMLF